MLVEAAGVALEVTETGTGPATVLVHGMWSGPPAPDAPRLVTYDRRGHGGSEAPEPYTRTTVQEHGEDLVALLERLGASPAEMVGDGFGALVVLDVLLRHPELAVSAVLLDPPAYAFVPEATEALSEERAGLEEVIGRDGAEAAVDWWLAERGRERRAGTGARAFFADFGALATLPLSRRELGQVDVPVRVVTTDRALLHDAAAASALADALADAELSRG